MKHPWLLLFAAFAALAQQSGIPPSDPTLAPGGPPNPGLRRQQRDALAKQDFKDNLHDAAELVTLSQQLQASFERHGSFIVDAGDIRTAERIEKLSRGIRGRLKRF